MNKEELITEYKKEMQEIAKDVNILLIDDDVILQGQMKKILGHFFARIDCAQNGVDALDLYERRHYDIIITDLTMPLMNGVALAKEIKSRDREQSLFVVSAHNESEKLIELINIGVDGFFLKPLSIITLLDLLKKKCQALYDKRMKEHYSKLLDRVQEELKERNRVLEETFFHLMYSSDEPRCSEEERAAYENFLHHPKENFALIDESFQRLEERFNCMLLARHEQSEEESLTLIAEIFGGYAQGIEELGFLEPLAQSLKRLDELLRECCQREALFTFVMADTTELFDGLELLRKELFAYKERKNIFILVSKALSKSMALQRVLEALSAEEKM